MLLWSNPTCCSHAQQLAAQVGSLPYSLELYVPCIPHGDVTDVPTLFLTAVMAELHVQNWICRSKSCLFLDMPLPKMVHPVSCAGLHLQYTSLLGSINVSVPRTIHWISSATSFAFSSLTSGSLSTDCLLSLHGVNPALQRLLLRLAVPPLVFTVLAVFQLLW